MSDPLAEYADALSELRERFGVDAGWIIALLKDKGTIPQEAEYWAMSFSAQGVSMFWAESADDEWVRVE